ncbi:hypothetical protein QKT49_gp068 [Acanthamoeba castellanii medusavirus]|uniref:Uncharacterized protein n=1 Tax=Acanthamoeba castellanii medusavirus J1 TaxID=3114988 RepID=A0A3T1CWL0_9VIRU|nr:hypothetical protein QKT49_gp068 [Acanthamoeba castellanii medusavirus]BBI30208.1 hypothetical protein [Acanthamoeba castellanii medusavirus J1]
MAYSIANIITENRVLSRLKSYLSPLDLAALASINRATKRTFVEWITSSSDQSLLPPPPTPSAYVDPAPEADPDSAPRSEVDPDVVSERRSADDIRMAIISPSEGRAEPSVAEALRQWMNLTVRNNSDREPAHADVFHRLQRLVQFACFDSLSLADVDVAHPLVEKIQTELGHCFSACGGPDTKHSLILKETFRQIADPRNLAVFDLDSSSASLPAVFYTMRSGVFLPDQKRGLHDERVYSVAAAKEANVFDQMGAPCNPTPFTLVDDEALYIARPFGCALKSKIRPPPEKITGNAQEGEPLPPRPLGELVHTRPAPREVLRTSTIMPAARKIRKFVRSHLDDQGIACTTDNINAVPLAVYPLEWLSVTNVASNNPSPNHLPPVLGERGTDPSPSQAADLPSPASVSILLDPFRGRQPVSLHLHGIKTRGVLDSFPAVVIGTVRMPPKELVPIAKIRRHFQKAVDAGLRYASHLWTRALVHASEIDSSAGGRPVPNYAFIGLRLGYEDESHTDLVFERRSKMGHFLAPSVSNIVSSFPSDDMVYNVGRLHLETLAHTSCLDSVLVGAENESSHYLPGSIDGTREVRDQDVADYCNLHDACELAIDYLNKARAFFKNSTNGAVKVLASECGGKPPAAALPRVPIVEDFERLQDNIVAFIQGRLSVTPKALAEMPPPVAKRKRVEPPAPKPTPAPAPEPEPLPPAPTRDRKKNKRRRVSDEEVECERQLQRLKTKKRKRSASPPPAPPKKKKVRRGQKRGIEELSESDVGKYCSAEGYDERFNDVENAAIPVPLPLHLKMRAAFDTKKPPTVAKFCVMDAQRMRRFVVKLGIPSKVLRDGHTRKTEMDRKELISAYIDWFCDREESQMLFGLEGNHALYTEVAEEMERRIDKANKTYRTLKLSLADEQALAQKKKPGKGKEKIDEPKDGGDYYNDDELDDSEDDENEEEEDEEEEEEEADE